MNEQQPATDELSKTVALMRLMQATGGTVNLTGPALAGLLTEFDRHSSMEQRARELANTGQGNGPARTYRHAGCYVLGVAAVPA
jgi:hypothetical protein